MKKVIRLTESDLIRIVKRVIKENDELKEISDYDLEFLDRIQGKVIDSVKISGYELSLVGFPRGGKVISLTYNDRGWSKPGEQQKQPTEYLGNDIVKIFRSFKPYIVDWVNQYGEIHIGTTNKKRIEYYHNWLCDDFSCGRISEFMSQYYFTINKKNTF